MWHCNWHLLFGNEMYTPMFQLVGAVSDEELRSHFSTLDVLIYSQLHNPMLARRKLQIAQLIWNSRPQLSAAAVKCAVSDTESGSLEEAQTQAQEAGASFVIVVGDSEDFVRLRSLTDKDRYNFHNFVSQMQAWKE